MRLSLFNDKIFKLHNDYAGLQFMLRNSADNQFTKLRVIDTINDKPLCEMKFELISYTSGWGEYDSLNFGVQLVNWCYLCDRSEFSKLDLSIINNIVETFDGE